MTTTTKWLHPEAILRAQILGIEPVCMTCKHFAPVVRPTILQDYCMLHPEIEMDQTAIVWIVPTKKHGKAYIGDCYDN